MGKWADKPWERQKGESAQAFEAFSTYLEMGTDRSIRAVGQKLDKSRTQIGKWSKAWDWQERVQDYGNDKPPYWYRYAAPKESTRSP